MASSDSGCHSVPCFWSTLVISMSMTLMSMTVSMTLGIKTLAVDILKVKWHDFLFTVTGCTYIIYYCLLCWPFWTLAGREYIYIYIYIYMHLMFSFRISHLMSTWSLLTLGVKVLTYLLFYKHLHSSSAMLVCLFVCLLFSHLLIICLFVCLLFSNLLICGLGHFQLLIDKSYKSDAGVM